MSDNGVTIKWSTNVGAQCPSCGSWVTDEVILQLGKDDAHRLKVGTARMIARALNESVAAIEAKR